MERQEALARSRILNADLFNAVLTSGEWMEASAISDYKNWRSVDIAAKVVVSRGRMQLPERMQVNCECPDSHIK
jgi:hypothetical protein